MKCPIIIILIATVVLCTNAAAIVTVYIIPEYPDVVSCPTQPCTTLDDLLLNNSLSNISNVEFKLLPGVYNVTSNIVIQHAHNVFFGGGVFDTSVSYGVVLNCFNNVSFYVLCSYNITLSNLVFDHCGGVCSKWIPPTCPIDIYAFKHLPKLASPSLHVACCSFTSIYNIIIKNHTEHGIICYNMIGISHLNSITVYTRNIASWGIMLWLDDDNDNKYSLNYKSQNDIIFITNLWVGISTLYYTFANKAVHVRMIRSKVDVVIQNSVFTKHYTTEPVIKTFYLLVQVT